MSPGVLGASHDAGGYGSFDGGHSGFDGGHDGEGVGGSH
jgi:hypothetical protein